MKEYRDSTQDVRISSCGITTTLTYDAEDRVLAWTESSRNSQTVLISRTTRLQYDAVGNVITTTNPLNHVTTYRYDPLNRATQQIMANGNVIGFRYDDQTPAVGLTPPGRAEHLWSETPSLATYQPPALGRLEVSTGYTYNLLQQLTRVQRPDGSALTFGYDVLGRTTAITQPNGIARMTYDRRSGQAAALTAPSGGTLSFGYDVNAQPITTTWTGAIVGNVYQKFDLHGHVTSQRVNAGSAVGFAYDKNGTLRQAGALALGYYPTNGFLAGTTLGIMQDGWGYNSFGEPTTYSASKPGTMGMRTPVYSIVAATNVMAWVESRANKSLLGGQVVMSTPTPTIWLVS